MATALDLITEALLDLGVIADEETPTASQAAGGLRKLNNMLAAWNIQKLAIYGMQSIVFPVVNGKATYTLGLTGDVNTTRPTFIQSAYIRDLTQVAQYRDDIELYLYSDQEYQDYGFKGQIIDRPFGIYFNYAAPLVQATLIPIPTNTNYSVVLWANTQLSKLTLNGDINLAPGYERALAANLALELAPSYGSGATLSEATIAIARDSKADLKAYNFQPLELEPRWGWFDPRSLQWR